MTADRVGFFKYMVRSLAEAKGLRATFMPKPFASLTGSGCHAHLSLHDAKSGANLCKGGADPAMHGHASWLKEYSFRWDTAPQRPSWRPPRPGSLLWTPKRP